MNKIRILHLISVMDRGGQETYIMNVFRNINREKFQFDFLCSKTQVGDYDNEIRSLGGNIIYMPQLKKGNKITKYYYSSKFHTKFLKTIASNYDIAYLHNYHAFSSYLSVSEFQKAGFAHVILHSHNSSAPRPILHRIFKPLLMTKKITRFACSEIAADWLHGKRKTKNGDVSIINNGIELEKFKFNDMIRNQIREEMQACDKFVVGHIGRFNYQKNHKFLLEIFAEVCKIKSNAELWLVGKGELEQEIISQSNLLGISDKVRMLGVREDVNKLLQAMDVLAFPSLFEGLSVVLVEAQASSICSVFSDVISTEAIISDYVIPLSLDKSSKKWAQHIVDCKCDRKPTFNEKMIGFDIENTVATLEKLFSKIVNNDK